MFAPYELNSMNSRADLPDGIYDGLCTIFAPPGSDSSLLFCEYRHRSTGKVRGVDLLAIEPSGAILMRDFALMADDSWRDSCGARSDLLESLLPREVFEYSVLAVIVLASQTVSRSVI